MYQRMLLVIGITMLSTTARADNPPADSMESYPIRVSANQVREISSLSVDFGKLKLRGEAITVIPISTEAGITGAVLFGSGAYSYTPEAGKTFDGQFRAVMLRFNPKDVDAIIKLSAAKTVADKGASALAKALLAGTFRHCYHRGEEALIPSEHAIAADVFSQELGEVLFSTDDKTAVAYNFSESKMLYEKK